MAFGLSPARPHLTRWLLPILPRHQTSFSMKFSSFFYTTKTPTPSGPPQLFVETTQGEESISEEDLYRYTRQRWLTNEKNELAKRYLKFSLSHLVEAAVDVCKGARSCTKVLKLPEGLNNKVFLLAMDNGLEVIAKLPNPNAGPARYTTASEVATRTMLREVFYIPVPRILSWSFKAENTPVQAEFILEEKAPGVRLGSLWSDLPWKTKLAIVDQVADFDSSLTAVQFESHGCVYFKEHLQELTGSSYEVQFKADQRILDLDRYAIGLLTRAELWVSGREKIDVGRGPWQDPGSYSQDLGVNESNWIKEYAKPRMNYYRSLEDPETPLHALDLLAKYQQVAPFLVPSAKGSATANVLWHPDLHLDNMFVDPTSYKITSVVDWQSATVAPLFYQSGVHRAFRHYKSVREGWNMPEKPENFDSLSADEQKRIDLDMESETIHKYYELQTLKRAPRHWEYLQQPSVSVLRKPVWLVTGVWEHKDLFFLRDSLITLFHQWNDIFSDQDDTPECPISFSAKELDQHAQEEENYEGVGEMLSLFRDQGILPADGMVQPEYYDTAVENCRKYKEVVLAAAQSQKERDLYSKIWPYDNVVPDGI